MSICKISRFIMSLIILSLTSSMYVTNLEPVIEYNNTFQKPNWGWGGVENLVNWPE